MKEDATSKVTERDHTAPQRRDYDVAIVGASIAGCTAATLFGRAGRKVALIESHPGVNAYKKLCTTFVMGCATPTLQRLGVDRRIEEADGVRNGIDFWTRWGWIREAAKGAGARYSHGYSIRRQKLDPMLRQLAADTGGVDLMLGHRAERVIQENRRIAGVGVEDREGRKTDITARLVVAADGRHSRIAELTGVGAARWKRHNRFAYYAFFKNVSLTSGATAQMWLREPDVAYAFPMDDGLTILACALKKGRERITEFKRDLEGNFVRFLESLPDAPRFDPADRVSRIFGLLDYPTVWRRRPPPGLAFIGDAAVTADYVWGVGCGWAFQTAEWLADAAAAHLDRQKALDAAISRYRRRVRSQLVGHFLLVCDYQSGRSFNPIEKLMLSAGTRDDRIAELVHEYGNRVIPVRQFLAPSALARAAWVNVTRRSSGRAQGSPRRSGGIHRDGAAQQRWATEPAVALPPHNSGPGSNGHGDGASTLEALWQRQYSPLYPRGGS